MCRKSKNDQSCNDPKAGSINPEEHIKSDLKSYVISELSCIARDVEKYSNAKPLKMVKFVQMYVIVLALLATVLLYCVLKYSPSIEYNFALIFVSLWALFILVAICGLVAIRSLKGNDLPDSFYRYQGHIADVIRDVYEISIKNTRDNVTSKE